MSLRRLRLHGLIERIEGINRYRVIDLGPIRVRLGPGEFEVVMAAGPQTPIRELLMGAGPRIPSCLSRCVTW